MSTWTLSISSGLLTGIHNPTVLQLTLLCAGVWCVCLCEVCMVCVCARGEVCGV